MGRALVIGVVLVMLGAAIAMPGAVTADGDSDGGAEVIEYSVIWTGADSPAQILTLTGDRTLSDEDDVDDEYDEDEDDDGDEEDDEDEDESEDEDDDGDEEDDDEENEDDDDGSEDEDDGDANSDDEQTVGKWVDEIVDTVTGRENSLDSDSNRPSPSSTTTQSQTERPTLTSTPTPTKTATATESPAPAAFDVSNPTVDDSSLTPGQTLRVLVQVENVAEEAGTFDGQLRVDGKPVDRASTPIDGGEMQEVVFEHRFEDPGEYELSVEAMDIGTVIVTESANETRETTQGPTAEATEGSIQVVYAEVPADWVRTGAKTTLRATVVNTANRTVEQPLSVTIDGEVVGNDTVSLQPYERRVVSIKFVAADGNLSVNGVDVGTIDVRGHESSPVTGPVEGTTESGTGVGQESVVLVALFGLLLGGVGLLVVTRR